MLKVRIPKGTFMDDFMTSLLLFLVIAVGILTLMRMMKMSKAQQRTGQAPQPKPSQTTQLVEDMKVTQTSRIVDAVAVMEDMGETTKNQNYRHYCELIGTSMPSGGVIAPYSKREVAYYDLRCYRIENRNGRDVETLVAHEKSIDPFFFTDGSGVEGAGATRVYVDLESFGNNCILVNATNRVEGPNSDFTKAFTQASNQQQGGGSYGSAYAMVANGIQAGRNVLAGSMHALRSAFAGSTGLVPSLGPSLAPAYAAAGTRTIIDIPDSKLGSNFAFSRDDDDDDDDKLHRSNARIGGFGMGGMGGMGGIPTDLDIFLGGAFSSGSLGGYGGPKIYGGGNSMGSLIGIGLGALLSTLATSSQPTTQSSRPPQQQSSTPFRGYRLIEDVVPLNSPIYCLGEIYRHGNEIYMGRSLSESYPSSYFATKQEAEVINALK